MWSHRKSDRRLMGCGPPVSSLFFLESNLVMGLVVVAGTLGLTRLSVEVSRVAQVNATAPDFAVSGLVSYEIRRVWLPQSLASLVEDLRRGEVTRTHDDFRRFLESRHQTNIWYAYTARSYRQDGEYHDATIVRRPLGDTLLFPEFLVFEEAAEQAENGPSFSENSNMAITIFPDALLERDPMEVVGALMNIPPDLVPPELER